MFRPSQRALAVQESAIRKLDLTMMAQRDARFLRLNIGQPDVPTPRPLLDAIAAFQPDVLAYGPASGLPALREAAAAYHSQAGAVSADDVVVTTGGSEALLFAFTALCDPGDEILVPEPYYTNYNGFATVAGVTVKGLPTTLETGFALPDDAALDAAVTPRTRAVVFSNPANPTGAVYSAAEVARLAAWTRRRGLFLIADEVYRRIAFAGPAPSALAVDDPDGHIVVVDSLSKTYSACGLRLGFLLCRNPDVMARVERLGQARLGPQPLAQHVALAALALPASYYDEVRDTYARRVSALHAALAALPGVTTTRPEGAFYLMADLPVHDADAFARWLVTDFRDRGESVVVAPGSGFYADPSRGRSQIRLAAVLEERALVRAVEILGAGLAAWSARAHRP